jgi:hypothetical protein
MSAIPHPPRTRRWQLELLLVAVIYAAYDSSRFLVTDELGEARRDGHALMHAERWAHLDPEPWLNRLFTAHAWLGIPADFAYATLHYLVTPVVLVWLWRRRPEVYRHARTWLGIATVTGLAGFILFPTAPPRLLEASYGFTDTMAQHANVGWWSGDASVPSGLDSMTNNFAAMPSLHVGWAVWCGAMVLLYARRWWVRGLGVLYPVGITVVVMGTANHYLLDAVAGAAVMALAGLIAAPYLRAIRCTTKGREAVTLCGSAAGRAQPPTDVHVPARELDSATSRR